MNETMTLSVPLSLDELSRLVAFLAERGQPDVAFDVVCRVVGEIAARAPWERPDAWKDV